jgi:hypothetical protein
MRVLNQYPSISKQSLESLKGAINDQMKNVNPQQPSHIEDFGFINSTMSILTRNNMDHPNQSSIGQIKATNVLSPQ